MKKYYVTMNDTFMSGWGYAEGKINKKKRKLQLKMLDIVGI